MRLKFTKMQGAGNDFVMLNGVAESIQLSRAQWRLLADRHFGVGADQMLLVEPSDRAGVDFRYRIFNADGGEVEQCGNGSRCFARFVRDQGLTEKTTIRVQTMNGIIEPTCLPDGTVRVDMGLPRFAPEQIPFDVAKAKPLANSLWSAAGCEVFVVSMGNPHAVILVEDVDVSAVNTLGPAVQACGAFPEGVNVGFMQVLSRTQIRLRVYERGVGETLACGTGACAAVVSGIQRGILDAQVTVEMRGGRLQIEWQGDAKDDHGVASVFLSGAATKVFEGEIVLPD